jgi:hypothetical protein
MTRWTTSAAPARSTPSATRPRLRTTSGPASVRALAHPSPLYALTRCTATGPQSSISSSIAEDLHTGAFVMATGSAGGSRIITATLQNLHHHLDQGLSADETVHTARWHDQLGNVTYFEIAAPALGASPSREIERGEGHAS